MLSWTVISAFKNSNETRQTGVYANKNAKKTFKLVSSRFGLWMLPDFSVCVANRFLLCCYLHKISAKMGRGDVNGNPHQPPHPDRKSIFR